jgi:MYXO-CTERM domain-containing protein
MLKVVSAVALLAAAAAPASAAPIFTDWTAVDFNTDTATGNLGGASVSLQTTQLVYAVTNDSTNEYSFGTQFTPPLALSDSIGYGSSAITPSSVSVTFSAPVTDVIIHISSLASTLTFALPDNTPIPVLYVSGSIGAGGVVGNQVIGQLAAFGPAACPTDVCGTIKLIGTFTAFNFSSFYHTWPGVQQTIDGVDIQIGAESVDLPDGVPAPGALSLLGLGLFGLLRRRAVA